jgi:hypothetical protein
VPPVAGLAEPPVPVAGAPPVAAGGCSLPGSQAKINSVQNSGEAAPNFIMRPSMPPLGE